MLTNNVREWEPLWRAKLPVDELFETVVDSAFVGHAQARPGDLRARARAARAARAACVFVDDLARQRRGGARARLPGVHFRDTAQAIAELERWWQA